MSVNPKTGDAKITHHFQTSAGYLNENKCEKQKTCKEWKKNRTDALRVVIVSVCTAITVCSSELRFADTPAGPHLTSGCGPLIAPAGW